MAYDYTRADYYTISPGVNFFLDANIWIKLLQPKNKPDSKEKKYRNLFEAIVKKSDCKIILCALVVSEVINRLLRDVYMEKYILNIRKTDSTFLPSDNFYKEKFRPSTEFTKAYNLICDDIKNFHNSIILVNDGFGSDFRFAEILSNPPTSLDFNDYYYYNLCKKYNYILITDDKDFWVEDIKVITQSETLHNKHISHLLASKSKGSIRIN